MEQDSVTEPQSKTTVMLSNLDTSTLVASAFTAGAQLDSATKASRAITKEALTRLHASESELIAVKASLEGAETLIGHLQAELEEEHTCPVDVPTSPPDTVPATPVDPHESFNSFVPERTVDIDPTMSRAAVKAAIGDPRGVRVVVYGLCEPVRIGGGTSGGDIAIVAPDGGMVRDLEFVGASDASGIRGVKLGDNQGGCGPNLRFSHLYMTPELDGDFSALRALAPLYANSLVLNSVDLRTFPGGKAFDGFGSKWGMQYRGGSLFMLNCSSDGSHREHGAYNQNLRASYVDGFWNRLGKITDTLGVEWVIGPGRTFWQATNRVPGTFPAGGLPGDGKHVWKNMHALGTGGEGMWGGMKKVTNANGEESFVPAPGGPASGGSAITIHGFTGESVRVEDCSSTGGYCSDFAIWNELGSEAITPNNPAGFRCWMVGQDDQVFDPRTQGNPAKAWGTRRLELHNFHFEGNGSRTAILVAGVRSMTLNAWHSDENGAATLVEASSKHLALNNRKEAFPVEHFEILD